MRLPENIDLTENRRFGNGFQGLIEELVDRLDSRQLGGRGSLERLIRKLGVIPWRKIGDDLSVLDPYRTLIPTGSVRNIKKALFFHKADIGEVCHCCGKDLTLVPWLKHYELCNECDKRIEMPESFYIRRLIKQ
ncbi:ZZ-type zinc finger protein [Oceanobacillus kimchii]|uniref:Uncharacterized protein n=1 Tax=Oceanobacillus kimchii TaxID=746691 RepID=A0ABQ5TKV3_9BACI|nr:hypothetical protein [Oceanobacillus kimchii]GLO66268.1 hypothetical protein MACH08_20520 [Oceanobacillus kimchii]